MKRSVSYNILLAATFVWCAALFVPPLLASLSSLSSAQAFYDLFSRICHQFDSRSIHIFGYKLAVCARCFGIYLGFFAGVLCSRVWAAGRSINAIKRWTFALLPMLLDVALDSLGVHSSGMFTRLSTGVFFGVNAALILAPIIVQELEKLKTTPHHVRESSYATQTR